MDIRKLGGSTRPGRGMLVAMMGVLTVASVGSGAFSLAYFTDQEAVGGNAFTTGTVSLTAAPASAVVSYSTMMPGDETVGTLTLTNGTAQTRYAMTTVATNADTKNLRDQITLTIKTKTANPCSTFDGTTLYTGALASAAIGSTASGAQAGDRTLNASANESLCFKASLPSLTNNDYQGAATTATFTFEAEQTANNP